MLIVHPSFVFLPVFSYHFLLILGTLVSRRGKKKNTFLRCSSFHKDYNASGEFSARIPPEVNK